MKVRRANGKVKSVAVSRLLLLLLLLLRVWMKFTSPHYPASFSAQNAFISSSSSPPFFAAFVVAAVVERISKSHFQMNGFKAAAAVAAAALVINSLR